MFGVDDEVLGCVVVGELDGLCGGGERNGKALGESSVDDGKAGEGGGLEDEFVLDATENFLLQLHRHQHHLTVNTVLCLAEEICCHVHRIARIVNDDEKFRRSGWHVD